MGLVSVVKHAVMCMVHGPTYDWPDYVPIKPFSRPMAPPADTEGIIAVFEGFDIKAWKETKELAFAYLANVTFPQFMHLISACIFHNPAPFLLATYSF